MDGPRRRQEVELVVITSIGDDRLGLAVVSRVRDGHVPPPRRSRHRAPIRTATASGSKAVRKRPARSPYCPRPRSCGDVAERGDCCARGPVVLIARLVARRGGDDSARHRAAAATAATSGLFISVARRGGAKLDILLRRGPSPGPDACGGELPPVLEGVGLGGLRFWRFQGLLGMRGRCLLAVRAPLRCRWPSYGTFDDPKPKSSVLGL